MCGSGWNSSYFISPESANYLHEKAREYGPMLSGALFGAGWWFWTDAVVCNKHSVPFDQYLPGIIATLALIMINVIRRDELQQYDAFDDAAFCRTRLWLFVSYIVSFAAIVAAVWSMLQNYATKPDLSGSEKWPGAAGILQVICILASGLIFFVARTPAEDSSVGYSMF